MANIPRQYQPAPPPPPPDEDYWAALLAQVEDEVEDTDHDENFEWMSEFTHFADSPQDSGIPVGAECDWDEANDAFENDKTVQLRTTGFNRGGLLVEWNSLRGFVPASQLVDPVPEGEPQHENVLSDYVDRDLALRVIEIDATQNRLILSQRAAAVSSGTRAAVMRDLQPNTCVRGVITNVCDFGVFVDLGGVEGLIHISELSWGRVEHPSEIVQRDREIEVFILSVEREECRIALSLKRLLPDPWLTVENRYHVGQYVEGVVTSVVDFGAFTCLEEGLEGLIHISELAEGHFMHPRNVVAVGQRVRVRILNIDSRARRIGLSLRGNQQAGSDTQGS